VSSVFIARREKKSHVDKPPSSELVNATTWVG
jgi:hypothetical protein